MKFWRLGLDAAKVECDTYKLGLEMMAKEHDKSVKRVGVLQRKYDKSKAQDRTEIKNDLFTAKALMYKLEALRASMKSLHKEALKKYITEFERLEALGISVNDILDKK